MAGEAREAPGGEDVKQHLLFVIASFEGKYRGMTVPKRPIKGAMFPIVANAWR